MLEIVVRDYSCYRKNMLDLVSSVRVAETNAWNLVNLLGDLIRESRAARAASPHTADEG